MVNPILVLSSSVFVLILQQIISSWFVYNFFMGRDSIMTKDLWTFGKLSSPLDLDKLQQYPVYIDINRKIVDISASRCNNATIQSRPSDQKPFEKVILILIDALGSKFIPMLDEPSGVNIDRYKMPFIEKTLAQGNGLGFIAHAATPTVTMPRIKSLITGTIPSFLDLIHNLARDVSKLQDENIVQIAVNNNKSIVFYGDDTWLQLFNRATFLRSRETRSFYATDYTSVDTNVTEEAIPETELDFIDWDLMILHYLGLDHIGHVYGSNEGPLLKEKLKEMDNVVKKLHTNMAKKKEKTLIVVCGDHGMSAEGNHGGSTDLETNTAMIFLPINDHHIAANDQQYSKNILQVDFAITLSRLMGLPVPSHSRGVLIEPIMKNGWIGNEDYLACIALDNVKTLLNLADQSTLETMQDEAKRLVAVIDDHQNQKNLGKIIDQYISFCKSLQTHLLKTKNIENSDFGITVILLVTTLLSIANLRRISINLLFSTLLTNAKLTCCLIFLIPMVMQGSTDFIESEHHFWPLYSFIAYTLLTYITLPSKKFQTGNTLDRVKVFLLAIFYSVTFLWNHLTIVRDNDSPLAYLVFTFLPIYVLVQSIKKNSDLKRFTYLPMILGSMIAYLKWCELSPSSGNVSHIIKIQQIALLAVILYDIVIIVDHLMSKGSQISTMAFKLSSGWLLIVYLLARPHNLFNFMANVIMETSVNYIANLIETPLIVRSLIYINFAQSAFFNQGNTNLFTTIDVRSAFFGQSEYNFGLAIIFVCISTYGTQIYWILKLFQRIQEKKQRTSDSWEYYAAILISLRNYLSLSYYMFVCLILKNHLFIWSVISPKLLYHYVGNNVILLVLVFMNGITKLKEIINLQQEANSKSRISIL